MINSTGIKRTSLMETGEFHGKECDPEPLASQFHCHFVCLFAFVVRVCDCSTVLKSWGQDTQITPTQQGTEAVELPFLRKEQLSIEKAGQRSY